MCTSWFARPWFLWEIQNCRDWNFQADFWEVDLDSNFSIFRVRRFTEWPGPLHWIAFPVEILTKPLIHWIPPPFSLKTPFFFRWKVLRRIPCPKIGSAWIGAAQTLYSYISVLSCVCLPYTYAYVMLSITLWADFPIGAMLPTLCCSFCRHWPGPLVTRIACGCPRMKFSSAKFQH